MPDEPTDGDKPIREMDKSDLVNEVMARFKTPSYEAWEMTVPELAAKLKES